MQHSVKRDSWNRELPLASCIAQACDAVVRVAPQERSHGRVVSVEDPLCSRTGTSGETVQCTCPRGEGLHCVHGLDRRRSRGRGRGRGRSRGRARGRSRCRDRSRGRYRCRDRSRGRGRRWDRPRSRGRRWDRRRSRD